MRLTKFTSVFGENWVIGRYLLPLLAQLGRESHGVILDLACGESPFRAYFPKVETYLRIDRSPMDNGVTLGDMLSIPLGSQTVDVVLLFQAITDVSTPVDVLKEVGRVLKPGGQLLVFESMAYPEHDAPYDFYRLMPEGLRTLAVDAGFDMCECLRLGGLFTRFATLWNTFVMGELKRYALLRPLANLGVACGNLLCYGLDQLALHPRLASDYLAVLKRNDETLRISSPDSSGTYLGNKERTAAISQHPPLRLAVLALSISHFEAPLFRLCAQVEGLQFKVFYIQPVKSEQSFDSNYGQKIDWGYDLLSGYDSVQVANAKELDCAVQDWHADVVLVYGYGWPGAAQIILRNWLRRQAQVHRGTLNYHLDPRRPIKGRLLRPLGRLLLRLFHAHHYGGDYSRKVLLNAGIKEDSLFFVPYSIDTPYFLSATENAAQLKAASQIRADQGWEENSHVILFIAQHNWFKGPDIAMAVFQQVAQKDPKARFLVVGSGSMTDAMKTTAQQNLTPGTIHFAGFVPSAQTVPYYLASDLVICTSRYETWARMINEAMLCRCPCVASRIVPAVGGLIVHEENGYVVEAPESCQFVPVIQKHFALPLHDRRQMGDAGRLKAQDFAYEPHIENVLSAARYALAQTKSDTVHS